MNNKNPFSLDNFDLVNIKTGKLTPYKEIQKKSKPNNKPVAESDKAEKPSK